MEQAHNTPDRAPVKKRIQHIGFYVLIGITLLTPLFFIPLEIIPFQFSRTFLVFIGVVVVALLFLYNSFQRGTVTFSWSYLHIALLVLPSLYLIAALFSTQPSLSFLGYQLETDTFGFIFLGVALSTVIAWTLHGRRNVFTLLLTFMVAAWVVFIFQAIQIIFGAPFSLSFLSNPSSNLIGTWNDFGLFAGLVGVLTLLTLESLPLPKKHYHLLFGTFIVSLFFLALVNIREAWILFGITSFATLIFALTSTFFSRENQHPIFWQRIPSLIGLVTAIFFLSFGGGVATFLQESASISVFEARPSVQSTIGIAASVYKDSPVVGSGPNTFASQWLLHRPSDIVQTPFWNVAFDSGSGFILSSFATGGALVTLGWLVLIILILFTTVRSLFVADGSNKQAYFILSMTILGVLYLLASHIVYAPSQTLSLLLFLFIGLFLVSINDTSLAHSLRLDLKNSPRAGFAFVLIGVSVSLVLLGGVYVVGKKYISVVYHNQAVLYANAGDFDKSFATLSTAVRLDAQDRFYRTAALINLAQVNQIVTTGTSDTETQQRFQSTLAGAVQNTDAALAQNDQSFQNWIVRGLVFQSVVPLQIEGSLENTLSVYARAQALNPHDPEISWRLAQMYRDLGDTENARLSIDAALQRKADYTNAILLRAQIELDDGNLEKAIESIKNAIFFEPRNSTLLYQLGILSLQNESYIEASQALEASLQQTPDFANASFFLAQAYAFLDRYDEAAALMSSLIPTNPDNELIIEYRSALSEGRNPFNQVPVAPETEDEVIQ